jgi:hypothetical protein
MPVLLAVMLFVVFAVTVAGLAIPLLRRRLLRSLLREMPRDQPRLFELRLRDAWFGDPFRVMELLFSDARDAFLQKLWAESNARRGAGFDPGLPADGMAVHRTRLHDGRAIAVISMPPPQRNGEPHFIAVVLPQDPYLRRVARFFVLKRGSSELGRDTDLCGWTADNQSRDYNVGGPLEPDRFAAAVGNKLWELGL